MKKGFCVLLIVSLSLIVKSCNTTDPPDNEQNISLKLEDVSCTETWITLTTNNLQLPATVTFKQTNSTGGTKSQTLNLNSQDSLFYIDSLSLNQTYTFKASHSGLSGISSNELRVTTMDTTSHDFTWQTFEFGVNTYQNHLYDVAIVGSEIWAVGEIYVADTSQNGYTTYNAVHWDGNEWELKRIKTNACGGVEYPPIKTTFAFAADDILFAHIDGSITHYNGIEFINDCSLITQLNGSANKIWGISKNDYYVVSGNGFIARYNGTNWQRIESGTDLSLLDIASNDLNQIYICGGNPSFAQGVILKSIDGYNYTTFVEGANIPESELFNPNLYGSFSSIWLDQNNTLYSGGNILFHYKFNKWEYVKSLPENFIGGNPGTYYRGYITKVKGISSNDMWIAGDRNTLRHFNGFTWQQIGMPYDPQLDLVWRGIACNSNNIIVVGTHDRNAIIMMIKR